MEGQVELCMHCDCQLHCCDEDEADEGVADIYSIPLDPAGRRTMGQYCSVQCTVSANLDIYDNDEDSTREQRQTWIYSLSSASSA